MEIRNIRTPSALVAFSTLKPGDVFMSGGNVVMKTAAAGTNAVILSDGRMFTYNQDDQVAPVKAYIVKES